MTTRMDSETLVIAELLDIPPGVLSLCTTMGRLSRQWDEKRGSIVAFVRENASELNERDQKLVVKSLIGLQAPIIPLAHKVVEGSDNGEQRGRTQ